MESGIKKSLLSTEMKENSQNTKSTRLVEKPKKLEDICEELKRKPKYELDEIEKMSKAIENLDLCKTNERQTVLEGHLREVCSESFSPNGILLATASLDKTIKVWNIIEKKEQLTFQGHDGEVLSVNFSHNGELLASSSKDKTVKIWSITEKREQFTLQGHTDWVTSVCFSPDGKLLASASRDNTVKLWNFAKKTEEFAFQGHSKWVNSVCFSPNGKFLASASKDKTVKLWNLPEMREEFTFIGHMGEVKSLSFSPDNKLLASASNDKTLKIWNVIKKKEDSSLQGHTSSVCSVSFSPDGKFLASASNDTTVKVWNVRERKEEFTLQGDTGRALSVIFNPEGKILASASADCKVRLWNLSEISKECTLKGHLDQVMSVSFSSDGKLLASGCADSTLKLWSVSEKKEKFTLKGHSDSVNSVSFSPNCKLIASGSNDKTVKLWNVEEQREESSLEGHLGEVLAVSFSPDGRLLASGAADNTVKIWKVHEKTEDFTLQGHTSDVYSLSFSPDGELLASASDDKTVKVWNLSEMKEEFNLHGYSGEVLSVLFSPDGRFLVSASTDKTLKLWNVVEKREEFTLKRHTSYVYSVSFSPDGKFLASGSSDNTVQVWNMNERREEFILQGHQGEVVSVNFSPDGKILASASDDNTVKLWNMSESQENTTAQTYSDLANTESISPDGKLSASSSTDNTVQVRDCNNQSLLYSISDLPFSVWSYSFLTNRVFMATKRCSQDFKLFYTDGTEIVIGRNSFETFYHKTNLSSLTDERNKPLFSLLNALSSIKQNCYSIISNWNMCLSYNQYTPLHFAAFHGETDSVQAAIKKYKNIQIKADAFGRSPLFYSIHRKYQAITDLLLSYLIEIAQDESKPFMLRLGSFFAIRNDLSLIIVNSSQYLCEFLSQSLYYPNNKPPVFGIAPTRIRLLESFGIKDNDFVIESQDDAEPLRVKASYFELPSSFGSELSIELIESFLKCGERDLFKVQLISAYVTYKWNSLFKLTLLYTILLWANLVLLTLYLSSIFESKLYSIIGLIIVNAIFFCWECFQVIASGMEYFRDNWNLLDIIRLVVTFTWISFYFVDLEEAWINWIVVLLSVARGLTGFRAFKMTRFYIGLILDSSKKIIPFVCIFIYTTMCFGLLSIASISGKVSFHTVWMNSFDLIIANKEGLATDDLDLMYVTFLGAIFLNVILMLSMIISILGDSFDKFQLLAVYYDRKEICEVILEIEQIFSLFSPAHEDKYLHVCSHYYKDDEEDVWQGRAVDMRVVVRENAEMVIERTEENLTELVNEIKGNIKAMEGNICAVEGNLNGRFREIEENFNDRFKELEGNINGVDEKIMLLDLKLNSFFKLLAKEVSDPIVK